MSHAPLPPEVLAPIKAVFFQECDELLAMLDQGLGRLKRGDGDPEIINSIFRVVHSIKGGAANFELSRLAQFAHRLEMVLADLRAGKIAVDKPVLDCLLLASDSLTELVEEARGGALANVGQSETALQAFVPLSDASTVPFGRQAPQVGAPDDMLGPFRTWRFRFQPNASLYYNANDPIPLLRELGRIGEVKITLDDRDLPDLGDLRPDAAYLAWSGTIKTANSEEEIWSIFEFVRGDCDLAIAPLAGQTTKDGGGAAEEGRGDPRTDARRAIRVELDRVDKLFNLVGELLVQQTVFSQFAASHPDPEAMPAYLEFERLSLEIQEGLLAIRSQPIKPIFQRMARLVRQLETATGKTVNFVTTGEDAEVDRSVLEQLSEPLTHMIRNAVDHGLETAEERIRLEKDPAGTVQLSAYHRFGRIVIEVTDDGWGIDRGKVRAKAIANGLLSPQAVMSDQEIDALILSPGFSTSDKISDISGRGVGLDVVNRSVRSLGGRISINSQKGAGTTFTLSLPLTLALMDGMVVRVDDALFVVPVAGILENIQARSLDTKSVGDAIVLRYRDQYVPVANLGEVLGYVGEAHSSHPVCMIVENDLAERAALMVDEILGRQQIVVKEVQGAYRPSGGLSAATILGDGRIALIVDINDVVEALGPTPPRQLVA